MRWRERSSVVSSLRWALVLLSIHSVAGFPDTLSAPKPLRHDEMTATIKVPYATVREQPAKDASLVGFLPGAVQVNNTGVSGDWVSVSANWSYQVKPLAWRGSPGDSDTGKKAWIKRSEIALAADYVILEERWPLRFIVYEFGDVAYMVVFTDNNRCPSVLPEKLVKRVRSSRPELQSFSTKDMHCAEVWRAVGSDLVYFNLNGSVAWYDRKRDLILAARGDCCGEPAWYGYHDGAVKRPPFLACNPLSVACQLSTDYSYAPSKELPPSISGATLWRDLEK